MHRTQQLVRGAVALLGAGLMVLPAVGAFAQGPSGGAQPTWAATQPYQLVGGRDLGDRLPQPEDRYAMASGCYTIEAPGSGFVTRTDAGLALAPDAGLALPLHFQATRLGQYLLATNEGPDTSVEGAWWDVRGYVAAAGLLPELPLSDLGVPLPGDGLVDEAPIPSMPTSDTVAIAAEPGEAADWQVVAAGSKPEGSKKDGQPYVFSLPSEGKALAVVDGALGLVDGEAGDGFVLHHVADDDPSDDDANGSTCADWPEIPTNTSGDPAAVKGNPGGAVEGFYEAHIHGMAFEFLGGELRCGRPWHPYGVEYALPDCRDDGQVLNPAAEIVLAGADPSGYDPVGWPTFSSWPDEDLLTHEQWYWKWLQRAYDGGLRVMTNLLVENTALCQLYPQKKNSCNEMDSVRLQARRLFELQDYIDAQSGGPGEGWFRIVTTPTQARQVINAGRLAVVLGIEVSVLFDCGEILDQPQCTEEQIDQRVQEVHDMGVRQIEMINKFDNALSGVAGDGGSTGVIVNQGNKYVTGHYWDMRTCPDEAADGHTHGIEGTQYDKTQLNPSDDTPIGDAGGDVLAAEILNQFGGFTSAAVPLYPPAPHCNARGLTDLGAYAVRRIVESGIMFDPDHMSAAGQRGALDLIENEIIPEMQASAKKDRKAPIQPGLVSSHSWANDVTYQRIYQLGGTVAPMQSDAASFADRWAQRRQWAIEQLPDNVEFGMGYGADTNGFASQPGPRTDPAQPLTYDQGWKAPIGGVTLYQQRSGVRDFDINVDGVAHYGLYADWYREIALAADEQHPELGGGAQLTEDMLAGAENFLEMWERAVYGMNDCVQDSSTFQVEDLQALVGGNVEGFLTAIGQPIDREGAAYTYCVEDATGATVPMDVVFGADGTALGVSPSTSQVTPVAAPAPTPATSGTTGATMASTGAGSSTPTATPRATPGPDGHNHLHTTVASAPASGPGSTAVNATLVLLGAALLGSSLLARRRRRGA